MSLIYGSRQQDKLMFYPNYIQYWIKFIRFVYKDYISAYKELLAKGNHSMLYISRIRIIATEDYKALNELSPKYLQDMIDKGDCDYNLHALLP